MRYCCLILIFGCLMPTTVARAEEHLFAEMLYWHATEPVDWVLNTNRDPSNQYVDYETLTYDWTPGLRVGGGLEGEWDTKVYYTHFNVDTSDSASGNLTGAFLGAKQAQPPAPQLYFETGQIESSIRYNMFDWDIGKRFMPVDSLTIRPVTGLRGGWIDQSFQSALQAEYGPPGSTVQEHIVENIKNNFWGIGPKVGVETMLTVWEEEDIQILGIANFYAAYLLGHWNISDVTSITTTTNGIAAQSTKIIDVPNRDFGAVAFQAIVGITLNYRCCSATVGYELNDWLNQCQIFDDATGPHNNDLLLQGLTVQASYRF
ncbi:hypothetical protein Pan258_18710 [Symmachiella dynata]|nr:hypothetical protein Pan258_18710 [Symmachiella dynata]